jgi:hypothetical protein
MAAPRADPARPDEESRAGRHEGALGTERTEAGATALTRRPRERARASEGAKGRPRRDPDAGAAPALPGSHPAIVAAAVAAALLAVLSVTFPIADPDLWQHLTVGRTIWSTHSIPGANLWTWPTYGEPQVLPSWGFRALLWPFFAAAGVPGLFAWRWLTTLAAFGIAWAAARRMGARGFTPLVVAILGIQIYRGRSQARPETLVAVLLALQIWILEARRAMRASPAPAEPGAAKTVRDPAPWLIAIAWVWANVHISYWMGLALTAIHLIAADAPRGRGAGPGRAGLARALAGSILISFVNPFGWRALSQPFEYWFVWRHEPIFHVITELGPIDWSVNAWNGLPLVLAGWPLLLVLRARRAGFDRVEALTAALFIGLTLSSQRFIGQLSVVATPYLARDLESWVRSRRWPAGTAAPWSRAALATAACAALLPIGWVFPQMRPGLRIATEAFPVAACDFIAAHGVRGRAFNQFEFGGYLLWRFWPQRDRLPFIDIHQTGTPQDRLLYVGASFDPPSWHELDARRRFDWALVKSDPVGGDSTIDVIAGDSSWARVFSDPVGTLLVKRGGADAALADSFAPRPAAGIPARKGP